MLLTSCRSFFQASYQSSIPLIVHENKLIKTNSLNQMLEEMASLLGPICTTFILYYFIDKSFVLLFDVITYLISALLLIFLKIQINLYQQKSKFSFSKVFNDIKLHLIYLRNEKLDMLKIIMVSSLCILFTASLLRFILPALILKSGGVEKDVSLAYTFIAVGTIIGSIVFSKLNIKIINLNLYRSWFLYGLIFIMTSFSKNQYLLFTFLTFLGFVGAYVDILIITLIQKQSDKNSIGKNFGLFSTFANGAEALSGVIGGLLASFSITISIIVMSLLIMVSSLYYF